MKPEDLLHLFAPYLPTDRFRALLRNQELPITSTGAALMVDVVGFTPLTTRLVTEQGPERACEELKRRLNPMFEMIAGQVFHHGGSVIRFTGDGFVAWFADHPIESVNQAAVPALLRAVVAGLEMQAVMPLFRGLQLKVCIGIGTAHRWVVGQPRYGLTDVLSGPAVEAMNSLATVAQPDQVLVHNNTIPLLRDSQVSIELTETGSAIVRSVPETISKAARLYRWSAWAADGDIHDVLETARPFVGSIIRERVESGFGDFVAELRYALPMFIQITWVPEQVTDVQAVLNNYICILQDILSNAGGRLVSVEASEKGSTLFAVFGAPITHGDDASRAVSVALTLRNLASRSEYVADQRIGISRGLLYAGTIGGEARHEYTTVGDETNIAARLMTAATAGQILVTSAARKEVTPRVTFRELLSLSVKGKSDPIPVVEPITILSGKQQQTHIGQFVGRDTELNLLHDLLETSRAGQPSIVRVEGQAGLGKSRLIAQLSRAATDRQLYILAGDCISTGRNIAYLPWQSIFLSLLDLSLESSASEAVERLSVLIQRTNLDWLPRLPLLGELLGFSIANTPTTAVLEGQARRQALFALVTDMILHLARQQPMLLLFEDIQWLDEVSEALIIDLVRRLTIDPAPLMLVITHRPLETDDPHELIRISGDMPSCSRIVLNELSRADVIRMIESYLHARIPSELSTFIYERAHGNPLFVHEVIDTLLETEHIRVIGNLTFIERDLQNANLSQTIQGLVQARIDRLDEIDKLILKVAAVIGREFQVHILAASIPVPMRSSELRERLRRLEERDFLSQETPDPELTYLFRHTVAQEVIYQNLLITQRQQLHMAVAATLKTLMPDAVERLAYHFARSNDTRRARHYLLMAGRKAFREYANQAALDYLTQALALADSDHEIFSINRLRVQIMLRQGDMPGVQTELTRMVELADRYQRADWWANIHFLRASYYVQTSAGGLAISEGQKAIAAAQQARDDMLTWEAALLLGNVFTRINQREEVNDLSEMMKPLIKRIGDTRQVVELSLLQLDDLYSKNPETAVQSVQALLVRAQNLHDPVLEASCWSALTAFYAQAHNLPTALETARSQIRLLRQVGDRRGEGLALNRIGMALVNLGRFSEGNTHLLNAYKILHHIGERSGEAISLVYLGIIAQHYKAYDEALAYMNRGLAIQRQLGLDTDTALTLFHIGNICLIKSDLSGTLQALDEARTLLAWGGLPQQTGEIDTALGEIDMRRGDLIAAKAHIAPLLPRLAQRQLNGLILPGLAYWRAVQVLEHSGDIQQAAQLREAFRAEAVTILDKLTDTQWRVDYVNGIWYHTALLKDEQLSTL